MDNWGLEQINPSDRTKIASGSQVEHPQYGIAIAEVGPTTDGPNTIMVYEIDLNLPRGKGCTVERWENIANAIKIASELPVLHKEDFTHLGMYGDD